MRIILLINSLYTGGAEFSTLQFYSFLKKNKLAEISIVCLKEANPSYNFREFGFDEITYLSGNNIFQRIKNLNLIIQNFKPNIVHSVLFDANLIGRISRLWQGNFVHIESLVNQTYSSYRLKDPNVNKVKLEFYRVIDFITQLYGVDHFHSNGMTVAGHYQEKLFINEDRITNIPRGRKPNPHLSDEVSKDLYRRTLKLGDKVVLINVARHEFQKAQTVILDSLKELHQIKDKFILLLVGREGNATEEIESSIAKYNLQENVLLLGHRNDVPALLAVADAFVFPSRFEGLPGALIEAEAAGLPILCSNIPNNLEVVNENENALIFEVDDHLKLSQCIQELVLNEEKRKLMGKKSLELYFQKFQIDQVHKKMYDLFQQVLKSNGSIT